MHTIIVGAGWAGLAAAIELSRVNTRVTLIEAAKQAGGRARRIESHGLLFDNGQHLMLGAYSELLRLLQVIGTAEQDAFLRHPLRLEMRSTHHEHLCLAFPSFPRPFDVLAGFARARGLSWSTRYRALSLCTQLFHSGFKLDRDLSVADWLQYARQPPSLIKALWEPLCLAALNTPLQQASARIFIRVLQEAFTGKRDSADMLFPRKDLSSLFPDPAIRYIERQGGRVHLAERVEALHINQGCIRGVITPSGTVDADHVIIACAPNATSKLFESHHQLQDLSLRLAALNYEPICTIYLQYPADIRLGGEMVGLLDGMGQWILDLGSAGQPGRMAVVISGPGPHMALDNEALTSQICSELSKYFPHWPAPTHRLVIREKRATFSCQVGIQALRPSPKTAISGLWLAGDYTDTGLPATLEGAIRSGVRCARLIQDTIRAQM